MGLYVWITETGIMAGTVFEEYIPSDIKQNNKYTYYEDLSWNDINKLQIQDGQIVRKSEKEILEQLREQKLEELKQITKSMLEPTDWIYIKSMELKQKAKNLYPEIVETRSKIRDVNSSLKEYIRNASIVEIEKLNLQEEFKNKLSKEQV